MVTWRFGGWLMLDRAYTSSSREFVVLEIVDFFMVSQVRLLTQEGVGWLLQSSLRFHQNFNLPSEALSKIHNSASLLTKA
jgi:hypothetical protein